MDRAKTEYQRPLSKNLGTAALLVGTLDIFAAIVYTLARGGNVDKLLRYIASGVFGEQAFSGPVIFVLSGLLFHYLIALIWTWVFFKLYPMIKAQLNNNIVIGVIYGICIWLTMNLIVLPLSNVPKSTFNLIHAILSALILIVAIGLPLSYLANKTLGISVEKNK
ncbi:hypothetical protein [Sinomicrobium weinanense]|uniref:DUF1440 domain-containing protein n=1 Tax=Sinomicrobium weinanense TaxID=2842200 RepID=A0A926JW35_9FLAO|nr:hypothetical protein [Sinomicrobium weinanense]MBC9798231.1 hypothetical protein [Sinomicrobium weinanense]MBU3125323.1 DUF1440 domain-containing protein [Sinomicrobium weinanense]